MTSWTEACRHGIRRLWCTECTTLSPAPVSHLELRQVLDNRRATRDQLRSALLEALLLLDRPASVEALLLDRPAEARRYRPRSAPLLRCVLDWLAAQHEPATAREVSAALAEDGANVRAALRVAEAAGQVVCVGVRSGNGQGRDSRLWVLTERGGR